MKKLSIMLAAVALVVTGCDPYEDEQGGAPQVELVSAVVSNAANGAITATLDAEGDAEGWTIPDPVNNGSAVASILVVTFNKLLDGSKIQAAPQDFADPTNTGDCTPAADLNLTIVKTVAGGAQTTVTGAAGLADDNGMAWYACYIPTSPSPRLGGSIEIFRSETPPGLTPATSPRRNGFFEPATDYTISGTATDQGGATVPFSVSFKTRIPAPAANATPTAAGSVRLDWVPFTVPGAETPAAGTVYTVERVVGELDTGDDPDTDADDAWVPFVAEGAEEPAWEEITPEGGTTDTTFADTIADANADDTVYFYRVVASGLSTGADSTAGSFNTLPKTPALSVSPVEDSATALEVSWTRTNATAYTLERAVAPAGDADPVWEAVTTVEPALGAPTTITVDQTGLTTDTEYLYRLTTQTEFVGWAPNWADEEVPGTVQVEASGTPVEPEPEA